MSKRTPTEEFAALLGEHGATATIASGDETLTIGEGGEILAVVPDGVSTQLDIDGVAHAYVPPDTHFDEQDDYLESQALDHMADAERTRWSEFRHLKQARIRVLWKRKGGKGGGKNTWGKAATLSGLLRHYVPEDFVIWLAADHCREAQLSQIDLQALIYHELCHCWFEEDETTGEMKWSVRAHDVTAFTSEVERYGAWTPDLRQMRRTYEQLALAAGQ